ncbi:MAG: hypothetical protein V1918_01760, partial [Planctomycetota bacterium]
MAAPAHVLAIFMALSLMPALLPAFVGFDAQGRLLAGEEGAPAGGEKPLPEEGPLLAEEKGALARDGKPLPEEVRPLT